MLTLWNDFGLGRWSRFGFRDRNHTFSAFDQMRADMDRWLADVERPDRRAIQLRALPTSWPRMTLTEHGDQYVVRGELPGVAAGDLSITVQGDALTLEGKRTVEPPEGYTAHRRERRNLEFSRSITLPAKVDTNHVTAKLEDGVLELTLPKTPEVQPRQIPIKGS